MKLPFITAPLLTSLVHFAHAETDPIGYTLFDEAGTCRNGINKDFYDSIYFYHVSSDAECGRKCDNEYGNPFSMTTLHTHGDCICEYLAGELKDYTGTGVKTIYNKAKSKIMTSYSNPRWKCFKKNAVPSAAPSVTPSAAPSTDLSVAPSAAPSAGAQGDPHFKSWSQKAFDFHGVCDLVMLSNQKFENNLGIDIHIRTKKMRMWSYISALAIRIGKEILEVVGEYGGSYNVNGILYQGNSAGVLMLSGYPIHYKRKSSKQQTLRLNLGPLEAISIKTWNSFVSVHFENPESKHFKDSMGLLGSFPDGIWLARDNVTVIDDANTFGQEWQVLEPEANLFHEAKGPQQPLKKCEIPSKSDMRRRLSEHTMTKNEAERACVDVKADNVDICVFDVMATNDIVTTGAY